jgi:hypothetical protein
LQNVFFELLVYPEKEKCEKVVSDLRSTLKIWMIKTKTPYIAETKDVLERNPEIVQSTIYSFFGSNYSLVRIVCLVSLNFWIMLRFGRLNLFLWKKQQ